MGRYALNVRSSQLSPDGRALRVSRLNLQSAHRLLHQRLCFYRMSDEPSPGYFALGSITDINPCLNKSSSIWLELSIERHLQVSVTLDDIYGANSNRPSAGNYSQSIRLMWPFEFEHLLSAQEVTINPGIAEQTSLDLEASEPSQKWTNRKVKLRDLRLRTEMLRSYGPGCVFSHQLHLSLDGRRCDTQVGHLIALEYNGPDVIQNVLPMSSLTNWHWDEGIISMTNAGRLLVARNASSQTKSLYEEGRLIEFADSKVWPKAEFIEWHREHIFEKGRRPNLTWR